MYDGDRLIFCMVRNDSVCFMLNRRAGDREKPETYEGIRLYWAPDDLVALRNHLIDLGFEVSEMTDRYYEHTEFFLTDDDGYSHCFGVPTKPGSA
jgi:hypothetical protein